VKAIQIKAPVGKSMTRHVIPQKFGQ